jgi:tetratricopeptide (TPR) repeat protein
VSSSFAEPTEPPEALYRGLAAHRAGKLAEAARLYESVLRAAPAQFDALHLLGVVAAQQGRHEEACRLIGRALAINAGSAQALCNYALALNALGRFDEALASCNKALALHPSYGYAHNCRAATLQAVGRYEEALAAADLVLLHQPNELEALNRRGNALHSMGRHEEALVSYDRALALQPDSVEALNNRATALHSLNRFEEAIASCDRALALRPEYLEALHNRGNALRDLGRHQEALASYARALALRPNYGEAHCGQSLVYLALGDFPRGFSEYEWRWRTRPPIMTPRNFSQPLWKGDADLAGKTILLHAEQGLGDTLQFCRYMPMVAARSARVVLEVQPPLKPLLGSLAGVAQIFAQGESLPDFDLHCPLLSLPLAFDTRLETVPASIPYIAAPPDRAALWASRLGPKVGPRVGIVWAGSAKHGYDRNRSIGLAPLLVLAASDIALVSLQKELRAPDRDLLGAHGDILCLGEEFAEFADTAAVIAELDLIISVDTAVAHLAGAMGKPVFILLPYAPDWRWLLDRTDSPWYPTARLFRQKQPGDWDSVIARVRAALAEQLGF